MKKIFSYKKTAILVFIVLVIGGGFAYSRFSSKNGPTFREATITRGDIDLSAIATGVVQSSNRLEIKPPIAGRVEEVLVQEGQRVRKGQILAWMSSSERAALIDAARAKGPDELKHWEELYRPTPVIAPIDGMIILRNAEPGQTFQSQEAEFVMSDWLIVRAQVDETDIAQIKLKQKARITLDAYPNELFNGTVQEIAFDAKTVSNVTTYAVDVLPEKPPAFMRSGMTTNVNFILESRHDVLLVPTEAILTRHGKSQVLIPLEQDPSRPSEHKVELGLSDGRRTEVVSGLAEGDKVLVPQILKAGKGTGSNPLSSSPPLGGRR